jgi:hypothetical protein
MHGTDGASSGFHQALAGELARPLHWRMRFGSALDDSRVRTVGAVTYMMIRDRSQYRRAQREGSFPRNSAQLHTECLQGLSRPLETELTRNYIVPPGGLGQAIAPRTRLYTKRCAQISLRTRSGVLHVSTSTRSVCLIDLRSESGSRRPALQYPPLAGEHFGKPRAVRQASSPPFGPGTKRARWQPVTEARLDPTRSSQPAPQAGRHALERQANVDGKNETSWDVAEAEAHTLPILPPIYNMR